MISVLEGESLSAGLYDLVIYSTFLCTTDYYDLTSAGTELKEELILLRKLEFQV